MAKICGWVLILLWSVCGVCQGAPLGNTENQNEFDTEDENFIRTEASKKTQIPEHYHGSSSVASAYNPASHRNTKKSDMPEKGQIKFMKTLLGKVKTLLHGDEESKTKKMDEKKITTAKIPEKISTLASDSQNLYGVLGSPDKNEGEKSVNVISIPLKALKNIANSEPTENDFQRVKDIGGLEHLPKNSQVLLRPVPVRLASNVGQNKELTSLLPIVLQNQDPRFQPQRFYSTSFLPDGPSTLNTDPYQTPRVPFVIERHGDISKHKMGDEELYRNIGHIPGEISYNHDLAKGQAITGQPSLRHKNPVRYHHFRDDDDKDDDYDDDDDDDDYGDDDDDDDDDDNEDDFEYSNSPRMHAEERQIAATRKRLYDMLPGNDPTYTSENRGLGLPMQPPGMMQAPEAFLGNPMVQPGVGFNQRELMPSVGAALAGEHADNSNDRSVFMFGGQGTKQVFGDSDSQNIPMRTSSMKVDRGGFTLGGSHAQAMSPNEVSYMLQKQSIGKLSEKDKIFRPTYSSHNTAGVLLEVNGRPVGDSRELRDHVVNGVVFKGKEKVFKSKGPMDVKVSKATDGVHSKVVDITSADKVNVLEAKSKIAKSF